jgi:hypothetical protein
MKSVVGTIRTIPTCIELSPRGGLAEKDTSAARPPAQSAAFTRAATTAPVAALGSSDLFWTVVPIRLEPAVDVVLIETSNWEGPW